MNNTKNKQRASVLPFINALEKDRQANLNSLIDAAKSLSMAGFDEVNWNASVWAINGGRLINLPGKNLTSSTFNFFYSPTLGGNPIEGVWAEVCKALFRLRFHRKHQSAPNQRSFITAVGYIAHAASTAHATLFFMNREILDTACTAISAHYGESTAYNLHKAVCEFASHCDANGLCATRLDYRYKKIRRPKSSSGVGYVRLDDPKSTETNSNKLISSEVFRVIGQLYQRVPKDHKYRFYVLILTLLACLGRRFTDLSLMPRQTIQTDHDGKSYVLYFPRKSSKGDKFTPIRKLYMPSLVVPIATDVLDELETLCSKPRDTASEMLATGGPDLRFLSFIEEGQRLYGEDLERLGIPRTVLSAGGWVRKNGYVFNDGMVWSGDNCRRGSKSYTSKQGIAAYCSKDFSEAFIRTIHVDQNGKAYYLNELLFVRYMGLSSGTYSHWLATQCTHSMMTTFLRYLPSLAKEYVGTELLVDFTSHHFRHTLNTLLDEGGLNDLLQTEWFGRSNPRDTVAYQHTSREKKALMLREQLKSNLIGGHVAEQLKVLPISMHEPFLKARVTAVHDVGPGLCVHNFSQTPCERHLQCTADCNDYVWVKKDVSKLDEVKRQFAIAYVARKNSEDVSKGTRPKRSVDWLAHNEKKLKTLSRQLNEAGVVNFDAESYVAER